jgi:hypothetical protein
MHRSNASLAKATLALSLLAITYCSPTGWAQTRVTRAIDDSQRITLRGNTHPLAQAGYDRGAVSPDFPAERMMLLLQRSAEQESALQTFLQSVQSLASPQFHQYLTPQQFGQQCGPLDSDVQIVAEWLRSEGFTVAPIPGGRTAIEFSGTAAQVQAAFHTAIHSFVVNDEQHYANASDPTIPAALGPVISGVTINNFAPHPLHESRGQAMLDPLSRRAAPLFNLPSPNGSDCLASSSTINSRWSHGAVIPKVSVAFGIRLAAETIQ